MPANRAIGGEGGIRTHDTVSRIHAFQACALSHSATSPDGKIGRQYSGRVPGYNPRSRFPPAKRRPAATERFRRPFVILPDQKEVCSRRLSWVVGYCTDHHFDMGAWRPSRLILPSGSSVVSAYEGPTPSRAFSLRASTSVRLILH